MNRKNNICSKMKSRISIQGRLLGLIILIIPAFYSTGQTFHKVWGGDINPRTVATMFCQDRLGYLWIGVPRIGFIRYDGHNYELFKPVSGDEAGTAFPTGCEHDKRGDLWLTTRDGVRELNLENLNLKSYVADRENWENPKLPRQSHINHITKDSTGKMWFYGSVYIYYYDEEKKEFIKTLDHSSKDTPRFYIGNLDQADNLWVPTIGHGLQVYKGKEKIAEYTPNLDKGIPDDIAKINIVTPLKNNNVLIGVDGGLLLLKNKTQEFVQLFKDTINEPITMIAVIDEDNIWVAGNKVYKINIRENKIVKHFKNNIDNPATALFVDREEAVWVSFDRGGVYKLPQKSNYLEHITPLSKDNLIDTNIQISAWLENRDQSLWLGTNKGLFFYSFTSDKTIFIDTLKNEQIYSLAKLDDDHILVATRKDIYKLSLKTNHVEHMTAIGTKKDDPYASINDLLVVEKNELWISYPTGIKVLNLKENKLDDNPSFIHKNVAKTGYARFDISPVHGKVFISAYAYGVYVYDIKTKETIEYLRSSEEIPSFSMVDISVDEDDVYIYYEENYLTKYNIISKTFEKLPFPISGIACVSSVDGDNYLFQQDGDVFRHAPKSTEAINITSHKHVETETVTGFICSKLSNGKLITPTYSGILVIDPKNISDIPNTKKPLITVSEVTVNGESRFVNFDKPLMLNSEERNITLRINSHSYTEPSLNSFKYRMIGEHDWIELPNHKSTVVYSMLGYGKHILEVKGSNNSGLWSDTKTILIDIDTPLYLTKIAYLLYILIVITIIYLAGRTRSKNKQRIRKLRKEKIAILEEANKDLMLAKNNAVEQKNIAIEANFEKNRFLGNISHELRTPLTGIQGMIELLGHTKLTENQLKYLKVCSGCTVQLINHVNALLDLTKLKSGKFDMKLSFFSLKDWSKEIELLVCSQYLNSSIQYSFNNEFLELEESEGVFTDPEALKQVVLNLTGNALKFTEKGNVEITLSYKVIDEKFLIEISVSDSGGGIPKDKQNLIFEDFTQLENLETTNKSGSGLGLSICKKLITDLGGDINVTSTVGVGSIFKITLVVEHNNKGEFNKNRPLLDSKVSENIKVLIVEDNKVNRLVARDLLQYGEAYVDTCKNADEALKKINSADYEVIFVDCHMPGMSGYELAERIKQNSELKHLYIIALTADISRQSRNRCLASGMDDFISKPYLSSDLFIAINKYIQSKENADNALNKIFSRD